MIRFLTALIFILGFQSFTKADDISEFQINGISVGDSALIFLEKDWIESQTKNWYEKKFFEITYSSDDPNYENISLTFKPKDKNYIIYQVNGTITFKNINECLLKKKNIIKEMSEMFLNAKKIDAGKRNYSYDPTGESKTYTIYYYMKSGGFIEIACYDLTEKLATEKNWLQTSLNIGVVKKELANFLSK